MPDPIAGLEIRPLAVGDSTAHLTSLLHRAYARLAAMGMRYVASFQSEDTTRRRIEGGECYVGIAGGVIVATITFHDASGARGCPWYDRPDVAYFHQFAVEPELQGKGIGSALLDLVEHRARETGAAELACDTAESAQHLIDLYAKRGYRFVDYADWRPNTNYRSLVLSKSLGEGS